VTPDIGEIAGGTQEDETVSSDLRRIGRVSNLRLMHTMSGRQWSNGIRDSRETVW